MFALLLLEHVGRRLVLYLMPIARTGTPPGYYVNLVLLAVMLLGLALSLRRRSDLEVQVGERRPS
jgi:MYXO-CTERM domain-containing protein